MTALAIQDHISVVAVAAGEIQNQWRVNWYIYVSTILFVAWNKRFWLFLILCLKCSGKVPGWGNYYSLAAESSVQVSLEFTACCRCYIPCLPMLYRIA